MASPLWTENCQRIRGGWPVRAFWPKVDIIAKKRDGRPIGKLGLKQATATSDIATLFYCYADNINWSFMIPSSRALFVAFRRTQKFVNILGLNWIRVKAGCGGEP